MERGGRRHDTHVPSTFDVVRSAGALAVAVGANGDGPGVDVVDVDGVDAADALDALLMTMSSRCWMDDTLVAIAPLRTRISASMHAHTYV